VGPDLLAALDANYLDASRLFVTGSDGGEYLEQRDVAIVCCGLPVQNLNFGFLRLPCEDVSAATERVREYFTARKLPYQLAVRSSRDEPVKALEALGWEPRAEPLPAMSLRLPADVAIAPESLVVEEVKTKEGLAAFRETAFRAFGYPVQVAPRFMNERLLAAPNARLFAGRVGGEVVATSMLVTSGDVAGIYWVATLEAARGKGYGEALTWKAVAEGQAAGCRIASLQASLMGQPVYARMGFAEPFVYAQWLPPGA
jgi:GNAT superfamily N-acetyltransferase